MSVKIGMGRGKKGDGLKIDKMTKQRSYGQSRHMAMMSYYALGEMAGNPNTRAKDRAKLKTEIEKRARNNPDPRFN